MTARYNSRRRDDLLAETRAIIAAAAEDIERLVAETGVSTRGIGGMLTGSGCALEVALADLLERRTVISEILARGVVGAGNITGMLHQSGRHVGAAIDGLARPTRSH